MTEMEHTTPRPLIAMRTNDYRPTALALYRLRMGSEVQVLTLNKWDRIEYVTYGTARGDVVTVRLSDWHAMGPSRIESFQASVAIRKLAGI